MRKSLGKVLKQKIARRDRRKLSIRKKVIGTIERPRVSVSKGNKNLYVQVIDDSESKTILSSQTFGKNRVGSGANVESGKLLGKIISDKLKSKEINNVVFDRNGLKYCGVVAAVAQSMRDNGISL